ncbi:DUF4286 family protein [Silvanigrella sp.]|jgi:hypothetical protein|uniref:DUF4286 family protein n=1 Tax=Silvanigrella sp. TaxID=2024976 RepID=UPI0037C59BFC|nr:DUF4286 family protein [Silvanigrellaceae bacterium]
MILYEVTCILKEKKIEEDFVKYMTTKHVKEVFDTGCFLNASFIKTESSLIYRSSYFVKNKELLDNYVSNFAPKLRQDVINKFSEGAIEFKRTVSEVLFQDSI